MANDLIQISDQLRRTAKALRDMSATMIPAPLDGNKPYIIKPLAQVERATIEHALKWCNGNRRAAAKALEIGERTLHRKLVQYGLSDHRRTPDAVGEGDRRFKVNMDALSDVFKNRVE